MRMNHDSLLALDVGEQRIGVALASQPARLASPLTTLANDEQFLNTLRQLIQTHHVGTLVVGLPRGMEGQDTEQTRLTRQFAHRLEGLGLPVYLQDEAGTSLKAKAELSTKRKPFTKADIDALAATYILEDFMMMHDFVLTQAGGGNRA